jgi:hypothetical protein
LSVLVKRLAEFNGIHKKSKIVVCGCGTSLLSFKPHHERWITIGVNDVPALFEPTYLVVTDHPNRFLGKRKDLINKSTSKQLFTCAKGWRHPRMVNFELGSTDVKNLDHPNRIDHFIHSPYVAVGLAYKLGATKIGLIGVDFTNGHFYNEMDGAHPVIQSNSLTRVNSAYYKLKTALRSKGVELYNLSQTSRVELPKITIEEFNSL